MLGSRIFRQGMGVQVHLTKKATLTMLFSPQPKLQKGTNGSIGFISEKTIVVNIFQGYQLFPWGGV